MQPPADTVHTVEPWRKEARVDWFRWRGAAGGLRRGPREDRGSVERAVGRGGARWWGGRGSVAEQARDEQAGRTLTLAGLTRI